MHRAVAWRTSAGVTPPPPHATFSYQLGGPFRAGAGVGVVDRDRHVPPAPGAYGICYLNGYQAQPEELGWWRARHPSLLLRRHRRPVVDRGWNEQLLDTSTAVKRQAIAAIVGGWIRACAHAGYRAVEPDNLDSYTRSRGALTASDNLALARLLIASAHAAGLAIAQKNAADLAGAGRRLGFDFAIAEECQPYAECGRYLSAYGARVIEIEYPDNGGQRNFDQACRLRGKRISIVYRDRNVTPAGQSGFLERRCPHAAAAGSDRTAAAVRRYPWHTQIVSTTFWVGEIFDPSAPDGSQVYSTYDSQWERHYGGCDGVVRSGRCETEPRVPHHHFFPSSMTPRENPFYLDLPFDDLNDPAAFAARGRLVPWAHDPGYHQHIHNPGFSLMENRWVQIVGPNRHTCYSQIEDAGPGRYHDSRYVFGRKDRRPTNQRFNGAGMDVSPALNGCLGFADINGQDDKVTWRFVERPAVTPGPWLRIITTTGVTP